MSRLPALFIPHGGGHCFFMKWDPPDTWHRMAECYVCDEKENTYRKWSRAAFVSYIAEPILAGTRMRINLDC
jgi:hypothetical protein